MNRYTQTIVDLERAQALQAEPSTAALLVGAAVALCAVVALVLVLFTL